MIVEPIYLATDNSNVIITITSEKQFLEELKRHHEAAIRMAQQVLTIKSIRPEIKKMANDIIDVHTTQIINFVINISR